MTDENNTNTNNNDTNTDEDNSNNLEIIDCNDSILLNKNCKYFHHEPYYTPNNFDLYFDYNNIPKNIPIEKPSELRKRLQKTLPLTKIIHLNLQSNVYPEYNSLNIETHCTIKGINSVTNKNTIKKLK